MPPSALVRHAREAKHSPSLVRLAGAGVVGVVAGQTWLMGPAIVVLDVALLLGFAVWATRPVVHWDRRLGGVFLAAYLVQIGHVTEEYRTGFQRAFPGRLGYAWTDERFLAFNVAWLVLLGVSGVALARRQRLGLLGAWFLAIGAGVGNGLGHFVLALRTGGYFPGLYTAPLMLAGGVALLGTLLRAMESR